MDDLTILFYSANHLDDVVPHFVERVRRHLTEVSAPGIPIISVTHRPTPLGTNVVVGDIGISAYNVYKQILIGAEQATTPFVACAEDDILYGSDHWTFRPPEDEFWYDEARWTLDDDGIFWWRNRTNMSVCIAPRALMVETLRERFEKYPTPTLDRMQLKGWGEPGRYEGNLKLPPRTRAFFRATMPSVGFNHRPSLGGKRRRQPDADILVRELAPWGDARALWAAYYYA
jgi:hypothetical protein